MPHARPAKTAEILSAWLAGGRPTLATLATRFGVTRQRVHQHLQRCGEYRRSVATTPRERSLRMSRERSRWFAAHPDSTAAQAAAAWGTSESGARNYARIAGLRFASKRDSPKGDVAIIVNLFDKGLAPRDILKWLARRDGHAPNSGKVYKALTKWRKDQRLALGRWPGRRTAGPGGAAAARRPKRGA
jgi:hypothetical protein